MKRKRFSVARILAVLKQAEMGVPVAELIRQVLDGQRGPTIAISLITTA